MVGWDPPGPGRWNNEIIGSMYSQSCQTLGFCEVFEGIGIEEGVYGLGWPDGRSTISRGPSVDLAHFLDENRMLQILTQVDTPQTYHGMHLTGRSGNRELRTLL